MVFSAAAILRLPSIHRMMNLAYSLAESRSKEMRMFYFSALELLPLVWEIFLKELKNRSMVSGYFSFFLVKKESMVFWVDLKFSATSPRSPVFTDAYLTCFSLIPQLLAMDLTRISLPIYS